MANFELMNNKIVTFPVVCADAAGATFPLPAEDTITVSNPDPTALGVAVVGSTNVLTPLLPTASGIVLTVSAGSLSPASLVVDIVPDTTPVAVVVEVGSATKTSQAVPA